MSSRSVLIVLALLVLATGCSPGTSDPSPAHGAGAPAVPPVGKEVRRLVLPFDAYAISTLQIHTIESAEDVLIRGCMQARGMRWKALPRPSGVEWDPPHRDRYGLIESEIAARFGYHPAPDPSEVDRREAAWEARETLPAREHLAAFGREGDGGCWKQAHDRLHRGLPQPDDSLFNRLTSGEFSASTRDSEVVRVVRGWSACMKKKGFRYSSPLQVIDDARWDTSKRPSRLEKAVAQADIRCKEKTRLVAVWASVEIKMQNDEIRNHPTEFRVRKTEKDQWLKAARRVLARG